MNNFSKWVRWSERNKLDGIGFPGVYAIALSDRNISNKALSWGQEIIYIGMTNSRGGLKSRLQQFDNTIKGKEGHGGAVRVRHKYPEYEKLEHQLYVSVCPTECKVTSNDLADLRLMGEVAKQEYECFAIFAETFGQLPEFNDKERSPKR